VVSVFFSNTLDTTALHSMNPTHHINNDLAPLSNELHDLIDAHVTTLTQEHVASFDPSHPHSSLRLFLHAQFSEHLEQQLHSLRLYTTHQQLLIHQFVGNSPPQLPNTTHLNPPNPNSDSDPNPNPNPNSNSKLAPHQPTSSATTLPLLRSSEGTRTRHLLFLGRVPSPRRGCV
jgi:hypothetical protein